MPPQFGAVVLGLIKYFVFSAFPEERRKQFKMDASASKFRQVGTSTMVPGNPGQIGFMAGDAALAKKSGYCYIYISNETDDLVYFDNFTLAHERSSLIEETHYYPCPLVR